MAATATRRYAKRGPVDMPVKGSRAGCDIFDSSILETLIIRAWQERIAAQRERDVARLRHQFDRGEADAEDGDAG